MAVWQKSLLVSQRATGFNFKVTGLLDFRSTVNNSRFYFASFQSLDKVNHYDKIERVTIGENKPAISDHNSTYPQNKLH